MEPITSGDDLVTVEEGATRLGISERSAWTLLKQMPIVRYRQPGHGKTTFVRWDELEQAYRTPRAINQPATAASPFLVKKAAA